jgi:hypothetical protein
MLLELTENEMQRTEVNMYELNGIVGFLFHKSGIQKHHGVIRFASASHAEYGGIM